MNKNLYAEKPSGQTKSLLLILSTSIRMSTFALTSMHKSTCEKVCETLLDLFTSSVVSESESCLIFFSSYPNSSISRALDDIDNLMRLHINCQVVNQVDSLRSALEFEGASSYLGDTIITLLLATAVMRNSLEKVVLVCGLLIEHPDFKILEILGPLWRGLSNGDSAALSGLGKVITMHFR